MATLINTFLLFAVHVSIEKAVFPIRGNVFALAKERKAKRLLLSTISSGSAPLRRGGGSLLGVRRDVDSVAARLLRRPSNERLASAQLVAGGRQHLKQRRGAGDEATEQRSPLGRTI